MNKCQSHRNCCSISNWVVCAHVHTLFICAHGLFSVRSIVLLSHWNDVEITFILWLTVHSFIRHSQTHAYNATNEHTEMRDRERNMRHFARLNNTLRQLTSWIWFVSIVYRTNEQMNLEDLHYRFVCVCVVFSLILCCYLDIDAFSLTLFPWVLSSFKIHTFTQDTKQNEQERRS